jgi:hypothetical protein
MTTPLYQRFVASTILDFDKWHDGAGYAVDVVAQMAEDERIRVVDLMLTREITWREVEVLAAIDGTRSRRALENTVTNGQEPDARLAAASALHRLGVLPVQLDELLAGEIEKLTEISPALTRALLMAEAHPSGVVKTALLRASLRRNDAAMHCAALLCFLCGVAKEPFDWDMRPLFLRLSPEAEESDRKKAQEELCRLVGMALPSTAGDSLPHE